MQGHVLLGCITTELETALDVAAILSRSHIGVRLHRGVPESDGTLDQPSPCQIILLPEQPSQIGRGLRWLMQHDTLRYLYAYRTPLHCLTSIPVSEMANEILRTLGQAHTLTAVHLLSHGDTQQLESHLEQSVVVHESNSTSDDIAGIRQTLDSVSSVQSTHVLTEFTEELDLLDFTRGTEPARVLCGNPVIATHLPALLRMRGWLLSTHQMLPMNAPMGHQIIFCSHHNTPNQHQTGHLVTAKQTIVVDPNSILSEGSQTELQAQLEDSFSYKKTAAESRRTLQSAPVKRLFIKLESARESQTDQKAEAIVAKLLALSVNLGARQFLICGHALAAQFMEALDIKHYQASDELAPGVAWLHGTTQAQDAQQRDHSNCAIALAIVANNSVHDDFVDNAFDALCQPERQTNI